MKYNEPFYRDDSVYCEEMILAAEPYNAMHLLYRRSPEESIFLPLNNVQYLSIIHRDEVIFLDRHDDRQIEFAWRLFRPEVRHALTDFVPFCLECYQVKGIESARQVVEEFNEAVIHLWQKESQKHLTGQGNCVVSFPPP